MPMSTPLTKTSSSPTRAIAPLVGAVCVALSSAPAARAAELSPSTFATLTSVITVALGRHENLDVLSSAFLHPLGEFLGSYH